VIPAVPRFGKINRPTLFNVYDQLPTYLIIWSSSTIADVHCSLYHPSSCFYVKSTTTL